MPLVKWKPAIRLPKYPHLLSAEVPIWDRWLQLHGHTFTQFAYDVHVGQGIGGVLGLNEATQRAADVLSKKRIDVLGERPGEFWLFEIKPFAGVGAIGQILSYTWLWNKEVPSRPITHWGLVTDHTDADTIDVCRAHSIRVWQV